MNSSCVCGCCEGVEIAVPQSIANRPGLPALAYRVGDYATFFETMIARLSSKDYPALAGLKTRDPGDPSIALLDSWAVLADVLTFYQERIANEGYLRTALERRSVLEMARLIGYTLRPGVSATVYLAYKLSQDNSTNPPGPTETTIPAGARSQSVPGPGQTAQSFETSEPLDARSEWNDLQPRLSRPQLITSEVDFETDATTRDTLYFSGTATNLKTGDALLIVFDDSPPQTVPPGGDPLPVLRLVESIDTKTDPTLTEATLQEDPSTLQSDSSVSNLINTLTEIYNDATTVYAGSNVSDQVAALLKRPGDAPAGTPPGLIDVIGTSPGTGPQIAGLLQSLISQIEELHDLAVQRHFTRLEPWLAHRITDLKALAEAEQNATNAPTPSTTGSPSIKLPSPLGNLGSLLAPLSLPPSIQPANSLKLARSTTQAFSPQSDMAPKLLGALVPAAASTLYAAWENVETPASAIKVFAFRVKASLFASTYVGAPSVPTSAPTSGPKIEITTLETPRTSNQSTAPVTFTPPTLDSAWDGTYLSLDAVYDKIVPGSWVAIQYFDPTSGNETSPGFYQVADVRTMSAQTKDQGFSAKVSQIKLTPTWSPGDATLQGTIVYAQAEELDLAEEPLDIDIEGDTIELDGVYDGLESGRWIIVSGVRTDIPGVSGVKASELVMIAGVEQGARPLFSAPWPLSAPPFSAVQFVTEPDKYGDRLVVGTLAADLAKIPTSTSNQQYSDQVELAPGFWVNAYVPTPDESNGIFSQFSELLVDPNGNQIEIGSLAATGAEVVAGSTAKAGATWAWRISSGDVHTILTLANKLAYSYDVTSVIIYGNVVKATQGQTRNETLGSGDGSQTLQQFTLKQPPLTFIPASNPDGVSSTLEVYVNNVEWEEVDTLVNAGPRDQSFITQTENDDNTTVIFGTGANGARLPTGVGNVTAIYRNGIGSSGNVDVGQISLLQTRPLNVQSVINPLPASGGADRDSLNQARTNAPVVTLALDRLVSVQDYADFARNFAGIGKTSSARLSDGRRELVHLTITGAEDIPIDYSSDLYQNLLTALLANGDPYEPVQVAVRKLKLLVASAQIHILPEYLWELVVADIRAALLDTFGFDQRGLGQPVFQSEVISAIQAVAGVDYVNLQILDSVAEDLTAQQLASLGSSLQLRCVVTSNLATPNPAPVNYPDDAILPAELVYLTPDIPDTLILNQILP